MPGPAPQKPASAKRRTNPTPFFRQLPFEGRKGDPPPWPLDTPSAMESIQWKKLWTLPQATVWESMRCEDTVALYVRAFCEALHDANPKMLNEVRQLDSKLGLSPRSMLDLRWEIETPEDEPVATTNGHSLRPFVPVPTPS